MKLLVISGTPKEDGLCHSLVSTAVESAKACGSEAKVITLTSLTACRMCNDGWGTCSSKHECEFGEDDGFNSYQKDVQWADGFIFVTPVYWSEVSEGMKTFIDRLRRCQATKSWGAENVSSFFNGKSSILVASAGGGGGGITNALAQMERAVSHMGGTGYPYDKEWGFYDYIAVNRWNQNYKRDALRSAVTSMISWFENKE